MRPASAVGDLHSSGFARWNWQLCFMRIRIAPIFTCPAPRWPSFAALRMRADSCIAISSRYPARTHRRRRQRFVIAVSEYISRIIIATDCVSLKRRVEAPHWPPMCVLPRPVLHGSRFLALRADAVKTEYSCPASVAKRTSRRHKRAALSNMLRTALAQ